MTEIGGKLDHIINSLDNVAKRLDAIESRFKLFESRLEANEGQVNKLDSKQIKLEERCNILEKQIKNMKLENEEMKVKARHEELSRELYSKRLNYLIYGLEESSTNVWESREQTEQIFRNFLTEGLQIDNPYSIVIVDVHRLPQHPLYNKSPRKINRPIIVKFSNVFDKHTFISNLKHLKGYNQMRREKREEAPYVYATEHLPKVLQLQKNKLIPCFREAKKNKQKTSWKLLKGEYCLFINNQRVFLTDSVTDNSETNESASESCES